MLFLKIRYEKKEKKLGASQILNIVASSGHYLVMIVYLINIKASLKLRRTSFMAQVWLDEKTYSFISTLFRFVCNKHVTFKKLYIQIFVHCN